MSRATQNLRRAIFAACKRAGMDDDARHAVQMRVTGKASMTQMDVDDMRRLLRHLNGNGPGWTGPETKREWDADTALLPGGPHDSKLMALWLSGYHLDVVRECGAAALAAWICRQTGLGSAKWCRPKDTAACIEALKDWLARDAGVDWSPVREHAQGRWPRNNPRARVMEAQWRLLHVAGAVDSPSVDALQVWVRGSVPKGRIYLELPGREQDRLIRELGAWLREVRQEGRQ